MKLFVWDFHGVLERGNDLAIWEISNRALALHGYSRRMSLEECESLAGLKWVDYFATVLPHIPRTSHEELHATCLEMTQSNPDLVAKHITLNEHVKYVLEQIDQSPYTQILISNTVSHVLDWFVSQLKLENFFPSDRRFGVDAHPQHANKLDCLKNFLNAHDFPEGVVSIGDSPSDMQLIDVHPKGVGYMYTYPGRYHRSAECHHKIHDLRHVLKEVNTMAYYE